MKYYNLYHDYAAAIRLDVAFDDPTWDALIALRLVTCQVALFHSIKPLFRNRPLLIILNKPLSLAYLSAAFWRSLLVHFWYRLGQKPHTSSYHIIPS